MKKLASILGSVAFLAMVNMSPVMASIPQVGTVQGLVSGSGGAAISGASVHVVCSNGASTPQNATTDGSGLYFVVFTNNTCVLGNTVTVTATSGAQTGTRTGTMQSSGPDYGLHLDVAVVNVPLIPEFGLVTGLGALLASAGSYAVLKRRV
jgi:hypothetical protein